MDIIKNKLNHFAGGTVVKNLPTVQETKETRFDPWTGKIFWRRKW